MVCSVITNFKAEMDNEASWLVACLIRSPRARRAAPIGEPRATSQGKGRQGLLVHERVAPNRWAYEASLILGSLATRLPRLFGSSNWSNQGRTGASSGSVWYNFLI